jgi:hypothetical protein
VKVDQLEPSVESHCCNEPLAAMVLELSVRWCTVVYILNVYIDYPAGAETFIRQPPRHLQRRACVTQSRKARLA